jgi:DNA mismatch repair protein MutS
MSTPLMEQYQAIKQRHPGEILFFHLGDFYEMFYEDAQTAARVLNITLTARQKGQTRIPMAGVPVRAASAYIRRLLAAGHRVAVCDQTQPADEADGLVERTVVRVITPGTLLEDDSLDARAPNYLAALQINALECGLAWTDVSTGALCVADLSAQELPAELARLSPSECLVPAEWIESNGAGRDALRPLCGTLTPWPQWHFERDGAVRALLEHLGVVDLEGFGAGDLKLSLGAAGAVLAYLRATCRGPLAQITRLAPRSRARHVLLNRQTQAALELTRTMGSGERAGSLLGVLDRTVTSMGARLLRERITAPLTDLERIRGRLDEVERFVRRADDRRAVQAALKDVCDIERVLGRVGTGTAGPRDLGHLRATLKALPAIRKIESVPLHEALAEFLDHALADELPAAIADGGAVRDGFDPELDALRRSARGGKEWILQFEQKEIARTGIPSLKVVYSQVFGYAIEVTHAHKRKVPADYIRTQTLKNAERYSTPALKAYEASVVEAEAGALKLEQKLLEQIRARVVGEMAPLQRTAGALARLDVALAMAQVAEEYRYVRPVVDDSMTIELKEARHPTLERALEAPFVPNDLTLEPGRILLITGPNMAGKSTILRQTALIALMAQMGSFVPAAAARVGAVDKIFTRAGAVDELTRGASTFMVEMSETAQILNTATERSLVILDEIGRGTSTYDGVSIAWAVVEHLHDTVKARTLFATHYHELTELAASLPRVRNLHVAVREWRDRIVFLHRIVEGGTDRSYGIHVARLAGVPAPVTQRADAILRFLEAAHRLKRPDRQELAQLPLFAPAPEDPAVRHVVEALRGLDVNAITPREALERLAQLVERLGPPAAPR